MRRELVHRIEECMRVHKIILPTLLIKERINDTLNEGLEGAVSPVQTNKESSTPSRIVEQQKEPNGSYSLTRKGTPQATGTIPKTAQQQTPGTEEATIEQPKANNEALERMEHLERMLASVMTMLTRPGSHGVQSDNERDKGQKSDRQRTSRKSGTYSQQHDSSSSEDEDTIVRNKHQQQRTSHQDRVFAPTSSTCRNRTSGHSQPTLNWQQDYESSSSCSSVGRPRREHRHLRHGFRQEYEARDHLYRVEKWKLKFTGDPRSISVENFLYKIKKIAEREGVSDRQLLRDIHLLLEGPASDWFFTFVD